MDESWKVKLDQPSSACIAHVPALALFQRVNVGAYLWHRSGPRQLSSNPSLSLQQST